MIKGKKFVVVMPAYNAARTLRRTYDEVMDQGIVDLVVLVDDCSQDDTAEIARSLPQTVVHNFRRSVKYGFGGLGTALQFRLARLGLVSPARFAARRREA